MRIGFCAPWEQATIVADAGFDYIEPSVAWGLKPEQTWPGSQSGSASSAGARDTAIPLSENKKIKAEAFNGFLPGDLKIVGQDIDKTRLRTYLEAAFDRLEKVGAERVVFGSAGSRRVPEGCSRDTARTQIIEFLHRCAPLAEAHGVIVAIEPLSSAESNIINSVDEAMEYVKAVDHANIRVLADLYHIDSDSQSHLETREAGQALRHVHVAGRIDRRVPIESDIDYLAAYFHILKEAGYDDRISVEASVVDIDREAPVAAHVLRKAWDLA